jgi:hypothetical protein
VPVWPSLVDSLLVSVVVAETVSPSPPTVTPSLSVAVVVSSSDSLPPQVKLSVPLESFVPLARVPGVRLFSIQQVHGLDQLQALGGKFPVTDLGPRMNQATGPFLDTAAVMMNLDLTISCDSAPAHLAGALGAPVWMPISSTPDWRWPSHCEDTRNGPEIPIESEPPGHPSMPALAVRTAIGSRRVDWLAPALGAGL